MQRAGASRFAQQEFQRHWRLQPSTKAAAGELQRGMSKKRLYLRLAAEDKGVSEDKGVTH
jgi:hypothetical protein